ncbi:GNAT family N-acetyltransferase [Candidatus Bathyarchaeota archaeon]|nr:MAG: GNAT family N-acetyltransferase [Candidatus Bathyarchaeota archaeon]
MSTSDLGPIALDGRFVRLEPLRANHAAALWEVAKGMDWGWMLGALRSREDVDRRITERLNAEERKAEHAFAVFLNAGNRLVGSTSYLEVAPKRKIAEIGSTWYSLDVQGTVVNPECKYLLLKHAFEDWGAIRVQLETDVKNVHSQRAIMKLGAKFEGRLRNHGIRPDGSIRDSMLYSIISEEWPTIKKGLEARIESFAGS